MAVKTYVNKTETLQVVYDQDMTKYSVVPNGTVDLDEKQGAKYGCLAELVDTEQAESDEQAAANTNAGEPAKAKGGRGAKSAEAGAPAE